MTTPVKHEHDERLRSNVVIWKGYDPDTVPLTFNLFSQVFVEQVSVGSGHYLFLTKDARVFSYGQNDCGQLGTGADVSSVSQPVEVTSLEKGADVYIVAIPDQGIDRVECGYWNSGALSKDGMLFMWGANVDGQCGCGKCDDVYTPTAVVFSNDNSCACGEVSAFCTCAFVETLSCGKRHTLAITRGGVLWSWGSGQQLGLEQTEVTRVPAKVERLRERKVLSVSCGECHSSAVVAKTETVVAIESCKGVYDDSPVTCSQCNEQIFKVVDTSDICIVTQEHRCPIDSSPVSPVLLVTDATANHGEGISDTNKQASETSDKSQQSSTLFDTKSSIVGMQQAVMKCATDLRSFFEFSLGTKSASESNKEDGENRENEARVKQADSGDPVLPGNIPNVEQVESDVSFTSSDPEFEVNPDSASVGVCETHPEMSSDPGQEVPLAGSGGVTNLDQDTQADVSGSISVCGSLTGIETSDGVCNTKLGESNGDQTIAVTFRDENLRIVDDENTLKQNDARENCDAVCETSTDFTQNNPETRSVGDDQNDQNVSQDSRDVVTEGVSNTATDVMLNNWEEHRVGDNIAERDQNDVDYSLSVVTEGTINSEEIGLIQEIEQSDGNSSDSESERSHTENISEDFSDKLYTDTKNAKSESLELETDEITCLKTDFNSFSDQLIRSDRSGTIVDEDEARRFLAKQFDDDSTMEKRRYTMKPYLRSGSTITKHPSHGNTFQSSETLERVSDYTVAAAHNSVRFSANDSLRSNPLLEMKTSASRLDKHTSVENPQLAETSLLRRIVSSDFLMSHDTNAQLVRPRSLAIRKEELANQKRASVKPHKGVPNALIDLRTIHTEVWTWGRNDHGQLGNGTTTDTHVPGPLRSLSKRGVVTLTAGVHHTLALTADNQVYSWGMNKCGQLGQSDTTETPAKVKSLLELPVWGVAAGRGHSVFLVDTTGFQPEVFYTGHQPSEDIYNPPAKTSHPTKLTFLKQFGWLHGLSSRGDNCACLVRTDNSGFLATQFEFLSSERQFYSRLKKALSNFLLPLQKTEFYVSGESSLYSYRTCAHAVVSAYSTLSAQVSINCRELTDLIQKSHDVLGASFFSDCDVYLKEISKYSTTLSDLIALDGISLTAKYSNHYLEKTKPITGEILELLSRHLQISNYDAFIKVLQLPLRRVSDYLKFASKLAFHYTQGSPEHTRVTKFGERVDTLAYGLMQEQGQAENTRLFWESATSKLECLRKPGRRLLRDSKTHPLSLVQNVLFSTHTFYLFNDVFVHHQVNAVHQFPLETVWVETTADCDQQNAMTLVTPEVSLTLTCSSAAQKADWQSAFNQAILKALDKSTAISDHMTPPLTRRGSYTFTRLSVMRDAQYTGTWRAGFMHEHGELEWTDGRKYIGKFKKSQQHGHGTFITPQANGVEVYSGMWRDGSYHGYGSIKYANGDSYDGYFKNGLRFGHGVYTQGRYTSHTATVYIGEWSRDRRHGYGVKDDILKGEKFMGLWEDNSRHGNGIVVTLDGMYFEGRFNNNKLLGFGVMLTDDNSCYEGEFNGITQLNGKGKLTLPNGDFIEGQFNGSWNDGLKINGTFSKTELYNSSSKLTFHKQDNINSEYYGKLCVPAGQKWSDIFNHCRSSLGYYSNEECDTERAWEMVAVIMSASKHQQREEREKTKSPKKRYNSYNGLDTIPLHNLGSLNVEYYASIKHYLTKAFDTKWHPLGKMMSCLVDVFRATYIGIGAHPRLLPHASLEVKSFVRRTYGIVRILFPDLPQNGGPVSLVSPGSESASSSASDVKDHNVEVVTAGGLLHPILLPRIYPALFDLYALYNDKRDEQYWERVVKLNRQGDVALLAYLGIPEKFWLLDETKVKNVAQTQKISSVKDCCYLTAIDTLQQISTGFCPSEKLVILEQTFTEISNVVSRSIGQPYVWCMDELFPIFQFIVVRSKIHHLGAEIHLMDDSMERHLQYGPLGIMFTTLKACYFQIQTEKMPSL